MPNAKPPKDDKYAKRSPRRPEDDIVYEGLDEPGLYFNRELSCIEFNRKVLDEAAGRSNPFP